jgi:hypothetical protein
MVPHGQFYCHSRKIKIPNVELYYSGKKIVMGFNLGCYKAFPVLFKNGSTLLSAEDMASSTSVNMVTIGVSLNQLRSPDSQRKKARCSSQ